MNDPVAVAHTAVDSTARTLSGFVHGMRLEQVPAAVNLRARHLMLDAIGCALAARREPFALKFVQSVHALAGSEGSAQGGRGVFGFAQRLPLRDAALLNGVLAHGLDYDDTHMTGIIHLSVSVLPTVYALAGERRASGADMLAAYIAALEAGARIASAARGGFHAHGFHPTGVVGAFASTLAAGRLLGLDITQLVHAQGIALSMASGSLQFIEDGAWTKRMHPGWAAQAAITAATFAANGIVAPQAPYEGRYGFYRCYLGEAEYRNVDLTLATAGLGSDGTATRWELENVAVKPFPMCHFVHASADAAIALHRSGLDPQRIRSVQVLVPAAVIPAVCEPVAKKRRPVSDYDAKFSLPYAVASGLLRGRLGLKELTPEAYGDAHALALMDRIDYLEDPDSTFPLHYTGEVRVTLDDGRTLRHREAVNRGHAERPLTNDEVRAKFFENAALYFPPAHAQAVCEQVLALDQLANLQTLETLLAHDPAH
ncbi:MAG: MmgE/PrpD family protein [Betaproteobacteria bacterium]|nr:MmgE/PrpD family protein [Betaproteobacteria bacterium]